jgi:hypothetical protein
MPRAKGSAKKGATPKLVESSSSSDDEEIVIKTARVLKFSPPLKSIDPKRYIFLLFFRRITQSSFATFTRNRKIKYSSDDDTPALKIPTIVVEPIDDDDRELPKKKQKIKNASPSPKRTPRSRTPKSVSSISPL